MHVYNLYIYIYIHIGEEIKHLFNNIFMPLCKHMIYVDCQTIDVYRWKHQTKK